MSNKLHISSYVSLRSSLSDSSFLCLSPLERVSANWRRREVWRGRGRGWRFGGAFFLFFLFSFSLNAQTLGTPYFCGFEDAAENSQWVFVNGTNTNQWVIGSATSNDGMKSLYISSDGGATAGYTADEGFVSVYRTFTLDASSTYQVSFNWKSPASSDGRLYVCWMPDTGVDQPTSGILNIEPMWKDFYVKPWVAGDNVMMHAALWQNASLEIIGTGQAYKLVFLWVSGTSSNREAGACIDNIQISKKTCPQPTNLTYSAPGNGDGIFSWSGTGTSYELQYRNASTPNAWTVITAINATSITTPELPIGQYIVWVRSICPNDTSIWAVFPNVLIFQSTENQCFNFDLYAAKVTGTYGSYSDPYLVSGILDYGYASGSSRHTIHYDTTETDPRTGNLLKTVPDGEVASVRLGNWYTGGEAESISYDYVVDSLSSLLLLKYAVVLNGSYAGLNSAPFFQIEILDQYGNIINCGKETFSARYNTAEWNTYGHSDADNNIEWKDWSTLGFNLESYIGTIVKIRLITKDNLYGGHFGYAYFNLSCASATLTGLGCGDNIVREIKAPDGFNYQWYPENDISNIVSTDQIFIPAPGDTTTYICKMTFKGNSNCFFTLRAVLAPRSISSGFIPSIETDSCRAKVSYNNISYTYTTNGNIGEVESFYWDFGNGEYSIEKNPVVIYDTPGTYTVSLTAGISNNECVEIYTDTVIIPYFGVSNDTIIADIVKGEYYEFDGKLYSEENTYVNRHVSVAGCDSIRVLILREHDKYEIHLADAICNNETYDFNGTLLVESGVYTDSLKSVIGADSIIILDLTVLPVLEIELGELPEICGDDPYFYVPYKITSGALSGYAVVFNDKARQAGFTDIRGTHEIRIDLPEKVRPDIYQADVVLYDALCDNDTLFKLEFMVKYPSWVLEQKWNDVIALLNSKYNGGYEFTTYQWYINGEPVVGETGSYIYLPQLLDTTAHYSLELIRADDGLRVFTCAIVPERRPAEDISVYPRMVSPGESIQVILPAKGKAAVWNTMGLKIAEHKLEALSNEIEMPHRKGVYILEIGTDEGQRKTVQVIVK